jgi:hypothetical protein
MRHLQSKPIPFAVEKEAIERKLREVREMLEAIREIDVVLRDWRATGISSQPGSMICPEEVVRVIERLH